MKPLVVLIVLLGLPILIPGALIGGKSISVQYSGPEGLQVSGTLYEQDAWMGAASMEQDGKRVPLQIYDMAYDPELGTVTICPGTSEDNFYCQTFPYEPGASLRNSEGKGGISEYSVDIQLS